MNMFGFFGLIVGALLHIPIIARRMKNEEKVLEEGLILTSQ